MGLKSIVKTIALIVAILVSVAEAGWQGPTEVITGTWGANNEQFGVSYGDTNDVFGGPFYILIDGKLIVTDLMNGRRKIYSGDGTLMKVVKCVKSLTGEWNEECRIPLSDYIQTTTEGNIWVGPLEYLKQQGYSLYSPTGQLIKTSTTRPLELGVVKGNSPVDGGYRHIIEYPGQTYSFIIPFRVLNRFQRDLQGTLHVAAQSSTTDAVFRVSKCGRIAGQMQMPENVFGEPEKIGIEDFKTYLEEYGNAVFGSDGNVYTWKRTPDKYSILKWTWVDDPNVPNGPDAPTNLAVATSINGLYLTWAASPQDPGCVTTYEIYRATSAGGVGSTIGTVNVGTVKYNDTTATAGTTYYYKIRAKAGSEYSPYTNEVSGKR